MNGQMMDPGWWMVTEWMGGWMDRWMVYRWMMGGGWTDGWTVDEWMDEWIDDGWWMANE